MKLLFFLSVMPAVASTEHQDPIAQVALAIAIILIAAKIGGDLAVRIGQPSVLGELLIGVFLGNVHLFGFTAFEFIRTDFTVEMLARLGVLILLFEIGLESTVAQMMKVGGTSFLVATLGVLAPFGLGWAVGAWLLPNATIYAHAFVGATLSATSVGITARVLQDLKRSNSTEARIILGAAVIDDVLGLVILAGVTGLIASANVGDTAKVSSLIVILSKALGFLAGALVIGIWLAPKLFWIGSRLRAHGVLLAVALAFCFLVSWVAGKVGLAPIVGAYAAGLILEEAHYREISKKEQRTLEHLIQPITMFLVPIFFVFMGMRTDLTAFAQPGILQLTIALTLAAIIGKQACSLAVFRKNIDRLSIGLGMIPRGEVGLIFANVGLQLTIQGQPIISQNLFSAVVAMVIITTLITPPALKWSFNRNSARFEIPP
jgi:Kef-type K+ transport system membrane component KefB